MNVMLQFVKQKIDERFHPDGYNIGIIFERTKEAIRSRLKKLGKIE